MNLAARFFVLTFALTCFGVGQRRFVLGPQQIRQDPSLDFTTPVASTQLALDPSIWERLGKVEGTDASLEPRLREISDSLGKLTDQVAALQQTNSIVLFLLGGFKLVVGALIGIAVTHFVPAKWRKDPA